MPTFDLEILFILHKGNLAVVQEAQAVLADAVHAIVRAQCRYVEQAMADAGKSLSSTELTPPEAALAITKVNADRSASVAKEVVGLAYAAEKRVRDLLSMRARANLDEFTLACG